MNSKKPLLIGIAGVSGCGKSSIAQALAARLGSAAILELDCYYRDLSHMIAEERNGRNFDHPDAIDSELLIGDLARVCAGERIAPPVYDFATHCRVNGKSDPLPATDCVIVEGLFTLHWPQVRERLGLKIFVETPRKIAFARRLARDIHERGRTKESVCAQFEKSVWPMAEQFILPTRKFADVVANGELPIEQSVAQIFKMMDRAAGA
jgi:uridine kinase